MYHYEIWDKKSSINGINATDVLKIHKITSGEVGLVLDESDKVIVLQYDNGNPLTKSALTALLEEITAEMNKPPIDEPVTV